MRSRLDRASHSSRWIVIAALAGTAIGPRLSSQQGPPPGAPTRAPAPPEITAANATGPAAEVLAFEQKIEAAVVKGDTAYVDSVLSKDFSFVQDDHWATGGKPQIAGDRAGFLKRVTDKFYLVDDLDQVKVEMHPDVAITYGRYVSLTRGHTGDAGRLSTIWFQRVYAKRNGQWQFLSHRTVHGPTPSPAGIDPTVSDNSRVYGVGQVWFLTDPAPEAPPPTGDEKEILQLDQQIGTAVVNGNVEYVRSMTSGDFSMLHGDLWTRGGRASLRDTQERMLGRVMTRAYSVLDFDHLTAEMHGDIAITCGRYLAKSAGGRGDAERSWFSVWFERVYAKRQGRWIYLSHRTVHGPTYGPNREGVSDR